MSQNGKMLLIGLLGLVLTVIGSLDFFTTDPYSRMQGESETVNYYLFIGIPLIILSIVSLVRQNKKIK